MKRIDMIENGRSIKFVDLMRCLYKEITTSISKNRTQTSRSATLDSPIAEMLKVTVS